MMQRLAISRLSAGGEGARAGLVEGDVLLTYNDAALETLDALLAAIQSNTLPKGKIRLVRDGSQHEIEVAAGALGISVEQIDIDDRLLQQIRCVRVHLTSGQSFDIASIALVNAAKLTQAEQMFTTAHQKLGSSAQRIRFRGSDDWEETVAAAVAVGLVNGILSSYLASEAHKEMARAASLKQATRASFSWAEVGRIKNIQLPMPHYWSALGCSGQQLIHSGDPFILAKTVSGQQINLMSQHIAAYEVVVAE